MTIRKNRELTTGRNRRDRRSRARSLRCCALRSLRAPRFFLIRAGTAAAAETELPVVGRGHLARRDGGRRQGQADHDAGAGRLHGQDRRQCAPGGHRRMDAARRRGRRRAAAAARGLHHQRRRHRRPPDRHRHRSAEHPLRRRDRDHRAANGFIDRLLPSDRIAVAGIGVGAPATVVHRRSRRVKQAIARMVGQKTPELRSTHAIAMVEAIAIERGDPGTLAAGAGARVRRPELAGGRGLRGRSRDAGARQGTQRRSRQRGDDAGAARAVHRTALDRRAEDPDLHQRRVHPQRRSGAGQRARRAGGLGPHQPVRAAARLRSCSTSPPRGRRSTRSPTARRRAKGSRRWRASPAAPCSP